MCISMHLEVHSFSKRTQAIGCLNLDCPGFGGSGFTRTVHFSNCLQGHPKKGESSKRRNTSKSSVDYHVCGVKSLLAGRGWPCCPLIQVDARFLVASFVGKSKWWNLSSSWKLTLGHDARPRVLLDDGWNLRQCHGVVPCTRLRQSQFVWFR